MERQNNVIENDGSGSLERSNGLREQCDKIETNFNYLKSLRDDEIQEFRDRLVEISIKLADLEREKKNLRVELKAKIDPVKEEFNNTLQTISTRKKPVNEEVYIFFKRKQKTAEIYNSEGTLIATRPLLLDELQIKMYES